ncbi:hypothetical protein HANVADRAFT_8551 [Hanseniaspora valbyensis NRRL Y-1626]|uniref:DUF382 domain-containing protein n=1 Tax=Hanseniaspora valbyensis NRRL Y-1626 TaxID=766949 RepID=A0A1B7T794_9ASCO|nr:hypothetical protein HANVADRAFT_8551 [Hanseniaspora valbyensis NRRL Y-1626]
MDQKSDELSNGNNLSDKSEEPEDNKNEDDNNNTNINEDKQDQILDKINSNKLRTTLFELKKINIKKYPSKLKSYHTSTNFYNAIANSVIDNTENIVEVPSIWKHKNPSKRYLNNSKFYINKPKFELPKLIELTGVSEMRDNSKIKLDEEKIEELNKISQYRTSGTILNGVSIDYEKNYNLLIKMGSNSYYNKKSSLLPFGKVFKESMDLTNLNSENDTMNLMISNDIRVGKLSSNLLKVLGIRAEDPRNNKKGSFPYWCKIPNFNNKVNNIILNEDKGIIDPSTGEYCTINNETNTSNEKETTLFGRKMKEVTLTYNH